VTLVDTSVWIDFFRDAARARALPALCDAGDVLLHPWVLGELALGDLGRHRASILADLRLLPAAPLLADSDVLRLVEARRLDGSGIGWVDAHLLGSTLVAGAALWTHDRRLARVASSAGAALTTG
jgi:predicted nucleic acid-binding protein